MELISGSLSIVGVNKIGSLSIVGVQNPKSSQCCWGESSGSIFKAGIGAKFYF
jgi:hypothetical protein